MYQKSKKNLLSSNISSTRPHHMVNFGPLAAKIDWRVWGTPANFNGFHVLASLLQRHRSTEANQTMHDVWQSPGLVDYLYIFGGCCPVTEFCQVQNSLCVLQVLHSPILSGFLHFIRQVMCIVSFIVPFIFVNIVHIYRVSIRVRVS